MNLKNLLRGSAGAVVLLWAQLAFAWDWNAPQRGWVDSIFYGHHLRAVPARRLYSRIHQWVGMRPPGPAPMEYTLHVAYLVSRGATRYRYSGDQIYITIVSKSYPAVVQYGACANDDNGFTISFFAIAGLPTDFLHHLQWNVWEYPPGGRALHPRLSVLTVTRWGWIGPRCGALHRRRRAWNRTISGSWTTFTSRAAGN